MSLINTASGLKENFYKIIEGREFKNSLCPRYANCQTAKALNEDYCRRYKCNTFYQIDTNGIYNRIYAYLGSRSSNTNGDFSFLGISAINGHRIEEEIYRLVQEIFQEELEKLKN